VVLLLSVTTFTEASCLQAWIDICGGITAFKHAGGPVVTASVDQIHFLGPARLGEILT
jgi:acyl-CoA hydrolase